MNPLPRFCDFFTGKTNILGEDANAKPGTRIVSSVIESRIIDAGGAKYSIQGTLVPSSGQKIFQVGEVVNVLFKEDTPLVILGHTWRKAQFEESPVLITGVGPLEIVAPAGISPPDPEPAIDSFVIFTQSGQFILNLGFTFTPLDAAWGENSNIILLRYTKSGDSFQTLAIFKINRALEATNLPIKQNDEGEVELLATLPVVDGAIVGTPIREKDDDLPLGRTLSGKENLVIKKEMRGDFKETNDPNCPGPVCGTGGFEGEISTFFEQLETDVITFEQSFPMLVGKAEDNPSAYNSTLLHSFVNKSNDIIQIYKIRWNLGQILGSTDAEELFKLFAPSMSTGPFLTVTEALNNAGFAGGDDLPLFRQGNTIVSTGFAVVSHQSLEDEGGWDLSKVFIEPYAFLKVRPATQIPFGSFRHLDVFAFNRTTNTIIGASFDNPTLEYDREFVIPHRFEIRRNHLDTFGGSFHSDIILIQRPSFDMVTASFVDDGTGLPNLLNPLGPLYLIDEEPPTGNLPDDIDPFPDAFQTINNVRFTGRDQFAGLRSSLPSVLKETLVVRQFITQTLSTQVFGLVDVDTFELTPLDEEEPDFETGAGGGSLRPFVNKGAFVFFADQRLEDGPPNRRRTVLRWPFTTDPTLPFASQDDDVIQRLIAHDHSIYVDWTNFERRIFVGGGDRGFKPGSEPPDNFDFIRPGRGTTTQTSQSYTNDEDDDRSIYQVTVDQDTGLAIVTKTTAPPNQDIVKRRGFIFPTQFSFHYAGVK